MEGNSLIYMVIMLRKEGYREYWIGRVVCKSWIIFKMLILVYMSRMVKSSIKVWKLLVIQKNIIVLWVGVGIYIVYMTPSKLLFVSIWVVKIR